MMWTRSPIKSPFCSRPSRRKLAGRCVDAFARGFRPPAHTRGPRASRPGRARKSFTASTTGRTPTRSAFTISRCSNAGRRTAGHSSRCRRSTRRTPNTGDRNIGMYRMQIFDGRTTGMHWQLHKVAARHGKRLLRDRPAACPSRFASAATRSCRSARWRRCPTDSMKSCSRASCASKSVPLVKCETIDLEVPAHSDFVIEGYIDPTEALRRRGTLRRSHRLLHAGGRLSRRSTSPRSRTGATRFIPRRSWASRRWRTSTWARRARASSCPCSR